MFDYDKTKHPEDISIWCIVRYRNPRVLKVEVFNFVGNTVETSVEAVIERFNAKNNLLVIAKKESM